MSPVQPVLVAGIPRSGTTWTGNVLAQVHGSALVHEPDNEKEHLSALAAKRTLGRFPVLRPGESAPSYELLWERALSAAPAPASLRARVASRLWLGASPEQREAAVNGRVTLGLRCALVLAGHPVPSREDARGLSDVVVKSVHAPLALEWLAHLFPAIHVVVVIRHPANVLSSWREMGLPDQVRSLDRHPVIQSGLMADWGVRPPGEEPLHRAAWQICLLTAALLDAAARHPRWLVVEHEDLCRRPAERFAILAGNLGMTWHGRAEQYLRDSDADGKGFAVRRRAAEQPERWRSRLTAAEVAVLARSMQQFPWLDRWSAGLLTAG